MTSAIVCDDSLRRNTTICSAGGYSLDGATNAMLPPRVPDGNLHQLDQLMEREPERVAAQVKAWMAED